MQPKFQYTPHFVTLVHPLILCLILILPYVRFDASILSHITFGHLCYVFIFVHPVVSELDP